MSGLTVLTPHSNPCSTFPCSSHGGECNTLFLVPCYPSTIQSCTGLAGSPVRIVTSSQNGGHMGMCHGRSKSRLPPNHKELRFTHRLEASVTRSSLASPEHTWLRLLCQNPTMRGATEWKCTSQCQSCVAEARAKQRVILPVPMEFSCLSPFSFNPF